MAGKRRRGEPADPVFAAEMEAIAAEHRQRGRGDFSDEWKARLQRGLNLPPELQPTKVHRHESNCYDGRSRINSAHLYQLFCKVSGQWVSTRNATAAEVSTARAKGDI